MAVGSSISNTKMLNGTMLENLQNTTQNGTLSTPLEPAPEPSLILQALQYNMLLTSSALIGLLISFLWCICHFVVKWCHSRSLNQYQSQQETTSRFFNSLGIPMSQHPHLSPAQRSAAVEAEMKQEIIANQNIGIMGGKKRDAENGNFETKNEQNGNSMNSDTRNQQNGFGGQCDFPNAETSLLNTSNEQNNSKISQNTNNSNSTTTPSRSAVQRKQTYDEMYARMNANCKGPGSIMTA